MRTRRGRKAAEQAETADAVAAVEAAEGVEAASVDAPEAAPADETAAEAAAAAAAVAPAAETGADAAADATANAANVAAADDAAAAGTTGAADATMPELNPATAHYVSLGDADAEQHPVEAQPIEPQEAATQPDSAAPMDATDAMPVETEGQPTADGPPPGAVPTETTEVTPKTAEAAKGLSSATTTQDVLGGAEPAPAENLLQPAGALQMDPLAAQAAAAGGVPGPESAAVDGAPSEAAAATPTDGAAAAPAAADGVAKTQAGQPAAEAPPQQDGGTGAAATPQAAAEEPKKKRRRSKWDTGADATPVATTPPPAAAAAEGALPNGQALPPPPAQTGPHVRKRGRWGPTPAEIAAGAPPHPAAAAAQAKAAAAAAAAANGEQEGAAAAAGEAAPAAAEGQQDEPPKKKKRRSRWEDPEEDKQSQAIIVTPTGVPAQITLPGGFLVKLPPALTGLPDRSSDPEVAAIQDELEDLNRRLQTGELNLPPEHERSPSPEPIYDRNGIRQNTREMRVKEKMQARRQELVEEMIKRDPTYRPPPDYRPAKKWKKIWIPQKEYPGTNFIGLIIGPRGNTQKRMQRETNTKIAIRGRGSVKEGAARDPRQDYGEDEELHVLITGDKQEDVDKAAAEIEDLIQPEDEARNEHKRMQLRELAALNGTLKEFEEAPCFICGGTGHRQWECPNQSKEVYKLPENIQSQVDQLYQRDIARMTGDPNAAKNESAEFDSFMASLGGGMGGGPSGGRGGGPGANAGRGGGHNTEGLGFGRPRMRPGDELPDSCKLYVGNLAPEVTEDLLRETFAPFGNVLHAIVLKDMTTQQSRGYGFVHFPDDASAKAASDQMHQKPLAGRTLVVRVRNSGPPQKPAPRPEAPDDAKLYVSNLPTSMNNELLRSVFAPFGEVLDARAIGSNVGPCRGFGFVTMSTVEAASAAIKAINGYKMGDKTLSVRVAGNPRQQQQGPPGMGMGMPGGGGAPSPGGPMRPSYGARPPAPGGPPPPGAPGAPPPYGAPPGGPQPPAPGYPGAPPQNPYGAPPAPYPGAPGPYPGAPPPYPGAPAPYPGAPPPYPGAPPPYGFPPPGAPPPYPGAPPPYGYPPPGSMPPYSAPPGSYPPPYPGAQTYGQTAASAPPPADATAAPGWQPPLPSDEPVKTEIKAENKVMSEYERFMAEMGQSLP